MFVHFPVVQVGKGSVVVRSNIDVLLSSFFFFFPLVVKKSIWVTLNYQGMYIGAGSFFWGGGGLIVYPGTYLCKACRSPRVSDLCGNTLDMSPIRHYTSRKRRKKRR